MGSSRGYHAKRRLLRLLGRASFGAVAALCGCIDDLTLEGFACPCVDGWVCRNDKCVRGASEGGGGAGGAAGGSCDPACGDGYRCAGGACTPRITLAGASSLPTSDRDSMALPVPQNTHPGDLLFVVAYTHGAANATFPGGWETVATNAGSCGGWRIYHGTKILAAEDQSPVVIALDGSTSTTAALVAYAGVDAAAPIEAQSGVVLSEGPIYSETPWTTGDITTFSPASMVVAVFTDQEGGPWSAPTGMTKEVDLGRIVFFDALQAAAGPTGAKQASGSRNGCGTASLWAIAPDND